MGPLVENDRKRFSFLCDPAEGSESSQYLRKKSTETSEVVANETDQSM